MPFRKSTISAVIGFSKRSLEPTRTLHRCFTMVPLIKLDSLNVKQFSFRGLKLELFEMSGHFFPGTFSGPQFLHFLLSFFIFATFPRGRGDVNFSRSLLFEITRARNPTSPTHACMHPICPCAHPSLFLHKPRTHVNVTKQLDEPRKRKNKFVGSVGNTNTNTIVCAHTSTAPSGPANARRANERPFYLCEKYVPSSTITSDGHRDAS